MSSHTMLEQSELAIRPEAEFTYRCSICRSQTIHPDPQQVGAAWGNTTRFKNTCFSLWKCPQCETINTLGTVNFTDIYSDYVLKNRRLDAFACATFSQLLKRLVKAGLKRTDRVLDFGCGSGIFLDFLKQRGFKDAHGFDPYMDAFSSPPKADEPFDCVVLNDVIEHCEDPRSLVATCASFLKPNGLFYIGTSDSSGVNMQDLNRERMRLHLPFHRTIFNEQTLHRLVADGFTPVCAWRRSYIDTMWPFSNYRFLDEYNAALGHEMDRAFESPSLSTFLKHPRLIFFAFTGYFFPNAFEPAVAVRKRPAMPEHIFTMNSRTDSSKATS